MSNMSYCRFEKTYKDLRDCLEALDDQGDIAEFIKSRNSEERPYVSKLVNLCALIGDTYKKEVAL